MSSTLEASWPSRSLELDGMSALEQVPRGSGSQLRNLRLRWDSDSKQIISFCVLTSSSSATTSQFISAFLAWTTAYDDLSLPILHTICEADTYHSAANHPHQPRCLIYPPRSPRASQTEACQELKNLGQPSHTRPKDTHHNGSTQHQIRQPRHLLRLTSRATRGLCRILGLRFRRTLEGRLDR
jgi:hypothetical protein